MRYTSAAVLPLLMLISTAFGQRCGYTTDGYFSNAPGPHAVFWCEDFDNYCIGGADWLGFPPYPDKCPDTGATADNETFRAKWPVDDPDGGKALSQTLNSTANYSSSLPFSLHWDRAQANLRLSRTTHSLVPAIQNLDPTKNAVNGTDQKWLILEFTYRFQPPTYGEANNSFYVELSLGDDRAPTDFVYKDCAGQGHAELGPYPIICQQYRQGGDGSECSPAPGLCKGIETDTASLAAVCGPLSETVHASLAVGALAFLDPEPCLVSTGVKPTRDHPQFFDGRAWRELRRNVYPGNSNNFSWRNNPDPNQPLPDKNPAINRFRLSIRANDFLIEHWNPDNIYSLALVPRVYKGPFSTVAVGVGAGCQIDSITHACAMPPKPIGDFLDREVMGCTDQTNSGREGDGTCTDDVDNDGDGATDCSDPDCQVLRHWNDFTFWTGNIDNMVLLDGLLVSADGACCKPDGTCAVMGSSACSAAGGIAHGPGTACGGSICEGACCGAFGVCTDKAYGTCDGNFRGIGTSCAADGCPCPQPWADVDEDDDVDADDFGRFQECFNPVGISAGCQCYDRNGDSVVDGTDFLKFISCATGPNILLTTEQAAACETAP